MKYTLYTVIPIETLKKSPLSYPLTINAGTIQVKADFFIVMSNNQERVFCQALEKTQRLTPNKLVAFSDTVFFAINDTQILIAVGEQ